MPERVVLGIIYKLLILVKSGLRVQKRTFAPSTKNLEQIPNSQSGFITSYVVILFLLAGVGLGVYLVQMRQTYKSKAASAPISGPVVSPLPTIDPSSSPTSSPSASPQPVDTVYKGEYFGNKDLQGQPLFLRNDSEINFDWRKNSPAAIIPKDNFSIRWSKNIMFEGGEYNFYLTSDDGMRVYIDNQIIIDDWKTHRARLRTFKRPVQPGYHNLKVEYFESRGSAVAKFSFSK